MTPENELADHYKAKPKAGVGRKVAAQAKAPVKKAAARPTVGAARAKAATTKAAKKIDA